MNPTYLPQQQFNAPPQSQYGNPQIGGFQMTGPGPIPQPEQQKMPQSFGMPPMPGQPQMQPKYPPSSVQNGQHMPPMNIAGPMQSPNNPLLVPPIPKSMSNQYQPQQYSQGPPQFNQQHGNSELSNETETNQLSNHMATMNLNSPRSPQQNIGNSPRNMNGDFNNGPAPQGPYGQQTMNKQQSGPPQIGPPPLGPQSGPPQMGGQSGLQMGGQSGPPQMGAQSGLSQMGGQSGPIQMGGQSGPLQMGGQSGPPQMGGQSGPPQMAGQSGPPQMGGQSGPPQMGGQPGPPQMAGPPLGPQQMGGSQSVSSQMGQQPLGATSGPPQIGGPPLGPQTGPLQMGAPGLSQMGGPQLGQPPTSLQSGPSMGSQIGPPPMGPPQMGSQYGPPPATNQPQMGSPAMNQYNQGPHMPPPMKQSPGQYMNGPQASMPPRGGPMSPQQMGQMGYPPQPPGQMGPSPYGVQQTPYQQQQPKKLDPDQMPSPIQVMIEDQKTRSGVFCTNQKGLVPPLVTTDYITEDQGNSGPRFIRSTMYNVPITADMMKQACVPFGLVISPLAKLRDQEYSPPIVSFGELGPVRCIRCKAYMCPFMQFIDAGRRFQCLFCKATTEVPPEYFQHLDHTGQRVDRCERPELCLGTYEFVATKEYCRNNTYPKPPAMIFLIDVSYNNIKSGLVHLLCGEMKRILKHLPVDQGCEKTNMKVGFITYNSTVHFYNIKGTLAQPQMMVVGDIQEMFMPLLDGFLCDADESEPIIDSLMQQIPAMFGETKETETILAPAIQAGLEALKASDCSGKLFVFHSSLPIAEAPGKLKNRDDRKLLATDKERTVLSPQNNVYNNLGQDCVAAGCSVDLFLFNNSYIDIATIGQVSRLTGGEIFKYTYFQADVDGHRLVNDVIHDVSRPIAFDGVMRVRTSTGVRATDFYGHFFMSNTTDMELASIDCDKGVAIEIKHDDKLTEEEGVYIQTALLYTSCSGQRRLRIFNLSLKTCGQFADLFRSCELDTIMNFYSKQCTFKLLDNNPKAVKDSLVQRCAQSLACYRKHCATPSSSGQLILPECMKLMPLYVNCVLKSDAMSGGADMTLDDRSFVMQAVMTMDVKSSMAYFYPRLIPIHDIDINSTDIPEPIRCSIERMMDNGVYILENGVHMFMWVGLTANSEWIKNVFGVPTASQANFDVPHLPILDNVLSQRIRSLVDSIRAERHRCMRLTLVRQRDKLESVLKHFLAEDRGMDGSPGYVDFLCHMHKEIRTILS